MNKYFSFVLVFTVLLDGCSPSREVVQIHNGSDGAAGVQGEQGVPGEQGAPGEQGPRGVPGEPGPEGIQGVPGEDGTDGTTGSSVMIQNYLLSSSCTPIGDNLYAKSSGSSVKIYATSACGGAAVMVLNNDQDSVWLTTSRLGFNTGGNLRVLAFN